MLSDTYGNIDEFKGRGYVSFLDILGFSEEIINSWDTGTPTPLEKILEFKRRINPPGEGIPLLPDAKGVRHYICRTHSISDSIVISHGLSEPYIIGDMGLGISSLISNIRLIWSYAISLGYTIRGAIDYGHIYWNRTEIIGPSFIKAYSLESNVAKVSRVIISSDFNKLLAGLFKQSKGFMSHQAHYFLKDLDGYVVINPHVLYDDDDERLEIISSLETMKRMQKNFLIREKYTPLLNILKDKELKFKKIDSIDLGNY